MSKIRNRFSPFPKLFNIDFSDLLSGDETPNSPGDEPSQNGMSKTPSAEFFEYIIKNKFRSRFSPFPKLLKIFKTTNDS